MKCKRIVNGCAALERAAAARNLLSRAEAATTERKFRDLLALLDFYQEEALEEFSEGGFVDTDSIQCAKRTLNDAKAGFYEKAIAKEIIRMSGTM